MRREPPPSPPVPSVHNPPATADAVPPVDPPGVCSGPHGLRVAPWRLVRVRFTPPNSLDVVRPGSTAPAARTRVTNVESYGATRSFRGTDASVKGQPSTRSSSFTAIATPPNGRDTSERAA